MLIDLRSDTVTKPSAGMRRAMAEAEVGDDVYGEDPSALRLETRVAELLGHEAALFVPSGTMGNQIALLLHCRRGQDVIVGAGSHVMVFESGAAAAWAGVQFSVVGQDGFFGADDLTAAIAPRSDSLPETRLVVLENTHNRSGGAVWSLEQMRAVAERARAHGLAVHLDGARLWNASVATGTPLPTLAALADTVSVCFSKGLGAPVGSALVGSAALMREARRVRKMMGGGMRQVGVVCAAALFALEHQRERLQSDHLLARELAEALSQLPNLRVDLARVQTNIVNIDVASGSAAELATRLRAEGVLVNATSPTRLRAVTHLDVSREDIERALVTFARVS